MALWADVHPYFPRYSLLGVITCLRSVIDMISLLEDWRTILLNYNHCQYIEKKRDTVGEEYITKVTLRRKYNYSAMGKSSTVFLDIREWVKGTST